MEREEVENGKTARGKKQLLDHIDGKRLTQREAIHAHCYMCMGFEPNECSFEECPLRPYSPSWAQKSVPDEETVDGGGGSGFLEADSQGVGRAEG